MSAEEFQTAGWATESWQQVIKTRTAVMFKNVPIKNNFRSKEEGRDCFDNVVHIIKIPADSTLRIERPVRDEDKVEYAQEWARWEQTHESKIMGSPIDAWNGLNEAQKLEFKAIRVFTIEQIAALPDSWEGKFMGFHDIRNKAIAFLRGGVESAAVKALQAEKDAQAAQITDMAKRLAELENLLSAKTEPDKTSKK